MKRKVCQEKAMSNEKRASTDAIIGASNRAKQAREGKLGNCSKSLHIGLFFDGVGRNKDLDEPKGKTSNIAKLFYAFKKTEESTENDIYWKYYISGLGTPYQAQAGKKADQVASEIYSDFKDEAKDELSMLRLMRLKILVLILYLVAVELKRLKNYCLLKGK